MLQYFEVVLLLKTSRREEKGREVNITFDTVLVE